VRTDENIDFAAGECVERLFAARPLAPRQKRQADSCRFGKRFQRRHMLAREDVGRCHQRALRAGLDRAQQRQESDDRLSRPHVTLQKPQHALRRRQVGLNFSDDSKLCVRQREGQGGDGLCF